MKVNIMKIGVDYNELKEIEKKILKGIKLQNSFTNPKTIAAFDIAYTEKNYYCVAIVLDLETGKELEKKEVIGEEIIPYSPNMATFREGPVILQTYRSLEIKPDILIVKGMGAINPKRVGLASYVGVLSNKACIGVGKELLYGQLEEENIIFNNEKKGIAIRAKEFANPVYVSPGHGIDLQTSIEIIKKLVDPNYKLPLPLHLAHKYVNKLKEDSKKN